MNIYETLGVSPIINAYGPATRLGGGPMDAEVGAAMLEASRYCVDIGALQGAACKIIADITGAEAGIVTSGASAGLLLAAASCMTGLDVLRMNRLPDTRGMRNEILIARSHRNGYDHAVRASGATLIEIGLADRFNGAGIRDCEAWEIGASVTDQTAAILYLAAPDARPSLAAVAEIAHSHNIPVIVDAAAQLPPVSNLRKFISDGADLVAISGGKAIGGPQASGILCGRRDLVAAAALQMFDHDVHPILWTPPPNLIDRQRVLGAPRHGIGRSCKVGKEQIVGLLVALRRFAQSAETNAQEAWLGTVNQLAAYIDGIEGCRVSKAYDGAIPFLEVSLDERMLGQSATQVAQKLQNSAPAIYIEISCIDVGMLRLGPTCLQGGEPTAVANRLNEILCRVPAKVASRGNIL
jgi:D-glucosaminate-6-phosphate ammonia-lyase